MFVCLCKAVTEQQINQAVEAGSSYAEVRRQLGVGTDCGCCAQVAKEMVRNKINELPVCEFAEAS